MAAGIDIFGTAAIDQTSVRMVVEIDEAVARRLAFLVHEVHLEGTGDPPIRVSDRVSKRGDLSLQREAPCFKWLAT